MRFLATIGLFFIALIPLGFTGCAMTVQQHEMLPSAKYLPPSPPIDPGRVELLKKGETAKRPVVMIAKIVSRGNAYASTQLLEEGLRAEAAKLGADVVGVVGTEITKDQSISVHYGYGVWGTQQISTPHMYGIAGKYTNVWIGVKASKDGVVEYIWSDGPTAKTGIVEGDKILTVNGTLISNDQNVWQSQVSARRPGDIVQLEYLDKTGAKRNCSVIIEEFTRGTF